MKSTCLSKLALMLAFCVILSCPICGHSQSQALDAQIEGTVFDTNGSVVPGTAITAINVETGARRTAASNQSGIFRFPILSLGIYRVIAEHAGFKRSERRGIELSAGQTASVTISFF